MYENVLNTLQNTYNSYTLKYTGTANFDSQNVDSQICPANMLKLLYLYHLPLSSPHPYLVMVDIASLYSPAFGRIVATNKVAATVPDNIVERYLARHFRGDWGDITQDDRKLNFIVCVSLP